MNYAERAAEDLRLGILHVLDAAPGRRATADGLADLLAANGQRASRADIRSELEWLYARGLVATIPADGGLLAQITAHGRDVAAGLATIAGVRRLAG